MEIRKAAAEDFDIVFDFIEKLWTYNTYDREEIRKVYMDVINDERSFAFLLWDEGVCRGMCHGDYFNTFWMSGLTCYVSSLITREKDRGNGYGVALLDHAKELAKQRGCKAVTLDSGLPRTGAHLSYSRFSEYVNTIYRVAKSPFGPWRKPKKDGIGGRRFYAAKSMQDDDGRRFYFGWAHDRADRSDRGEWYWGGTFCVPHEVVATADGGLDVKLPKEYEHVFEKPVAWDYIPVLGNAELHGDRLVEMDSVSTCTYGFLGHNEESYMLKCKIMPREVYDHFGILLKSDKEASGCLLLEFDVAMQRVSLVNLPMGVDPFWVQSCQAVPPATEPGPDGVRVCEKTFDITEGSEIDVKIIVDHDMVEVFVGEQVAFTYRIYAKPEFETGLLAQDARVEFYDIEITGK